MERLFVYGTLKNPLVQKEVIGREVFGELDSLKGFSLSEILLDGKKYPLVIKDDLGIVSGEALLLTLDELALIDEYETEAYSRIKVKLGSGASAWVYVKNEKVRCFIAITFSEEVDNEIVKAQKLIDKHWNITGKMTEEENLHLTLKFLGEIDSEKLERVKERLREIKFEGFEVHLGELGCFSYRGNPRIVWNKVCGKELFELQKKIDLVLETSRFWDVKILNVLKNSYEILDKEGFKLGERFMAHLTLARVKYVKDKIGFKEYVKNMKIPKLKFKVDRFFLFRSELKSHGPEYSVIESYACAN